MTVTVIEPDAIGSIEIVAHVNVRGAISIQIAEGYGEAPVERGLGKRLPGLVEKRAVGEREGREMAAAIVQKKHVGFAILVLSKSARRTRSDFEDETICQVRFRNRTPIDRGHSGLAFDHFDGETGVGLIPDGDGAIIGPVKIEVAVTVD